ncbi:hypothetical protein L1987_08058 [Smallanthus sonchifolius]|uniref:Uncharacterized protein n=1 Tax=Smallanthus sonchifolius TaxID=185202 RepID=A0ACB9JL79_9ASTR|nr:hypothetical protein L1987_08058 [Smallanthus sonchifolius]
MQLLIIQRNASMTRELSARRYRSRQRLVLSELTILHPNHSKPLIPSPSSRPNLNHSNSSITSHRRHLYITDSISISIPTPLNFLLLHLPNWGKTQDHQVVDTTAIQGGSRSLVHVRSECGKGVITIESNPSTHGGRGALPSEGGCPSDLLFLAGGGFCSSFVSLSEF